MHNETPLNARRPSPPNPIMYKGEGFAIGIVTAVFPELSVCQAEMYYSASKKYGKPTVIPFPKFSGVTYIPKKGDNLLFAVMNDNFFPLGEMPLPLFAENKAATQDSEGEKEKSQSRYQKQEAYKGPKENINLSGPTKKKLVEGNRGLLNTDENAGVVVAERRYLRVYSSEECGREYGGDHLNDGDVPRILDRTIDYELDSTPCRFNFEELDRGKDPETGVIKTLSDQQFYYNSKRKEDKYFQITTGFHKESSKSSNKSPKQDKPKKEIIRTEALREPDKNAQGKADANTKNVDPTGSACCDQGGAFNNGNTDITNEDTTVKSKGVTHNALYKKTYKTNGEVTTASKGKIEYQTRDQFLVFAEKQLALLGTENALFHAQKKADIIGKEEANVSSSEVRVEVKDKVRVIKGTEIEDGDLPSKEEGAL